MKKSNSLLDKQRNILSRYLSGEKLSYKEYCILYHVLSVLSHGVSKEITRIICESEVGI